MRITDKQRARLAEIAQYRPRGPSPIDCPFRDDPTGRALVKRGLVDVTMRRMKLASMKEPDYVTVCWVTDDGQKALGE